jgi:AcrR family transcriptional regulator
LSLNNRSVYQRGRLREVPKVSVAHSEQVRSRLLESTLRVLAEVGLAEMTIQDVVRDSGLSVGAIYTYFSGKDELLAAACELAIEQELANLAAEIADAPTARAQLEIGIRYWYDYLEREATDVRLTLQMWASAATQPAIRDMLVRRRERLQGVAMLLLNEAVARGELRPRPDLDEVARGFQGLLDGQVVQRIEEGVNWRRARAERRAIVFLDMLFAERP